MMHSLRLIAPRRAPYRWSLLLVATALLLACSSTAPTIAPIVPTIGTSAPPAPSLTTPTSRAFNNGAVPTPVGGLPDGLEGAVVALLDDYDWGIARAGIVIKDADTGDAIRLQPDDPFPSASLYKLFVLWAVQDAIAAGELADDTRLTLSPSTDDSAEDGYRLGADGDTITVARARRLMITASNNTAAWLLVEALGGWAALEPPLRAQGFLVTTTSPDLTTTPREVTRFFEGLVNETLDPDLDADDYALMRGLFAAQTVPEYLTAGLPDGATFAHKTGNLDGVLHDAGVLTLADGRVVYVTVLTEGDYQAGQAFMRDLARLLVGTLGG